MRRIKTAVLVSGGGTNLQALLDAQSAGKIPSGEISLVISNREGVYALERAKKSGVEALVCKTEAQLNAALDSCGIELIILAGYMSILSAEFTAKYENRIINIHPSLIPSFCGKGFYGLHVHEAALARGVKVTGATVHYVNEIPDGGEIIIQKPVEVLEGDTPETLQRRVMERAEWLILPQAAEAVCAKLLREAQA